MRLGDPGVIVLARRGYTELTCAQAARIAKDAPALRNLLARAPVWWGDCGEYRESHLTWGLQRATMMQLGEAQPKEVYCLDCLGGELWPVVGIAVIAVKCRVGVAIDADSMRAIASSIVSSGVQMTAPR
jgi:hypothetical protein